MRKAVRAAIGLSICLLLLAAPAPLAHGVSGGDGSEVEPPSVPSRPTVTRGGQGLEPDSDRVLVLVGGHLTVAFGTVTTDADGGFSKELTIPGHLPSGTYELQAIGDETLTTPLDITAAAGGAAASPDANAATEAVVARDRPPLEVALILAFVAAAAAVGFVLVWQAERFRGARTA